MASINKLNIAGTLYDIVDNSSGYVKSTDTIANATAANRSRYITSQDTRNTVINGSDLVATTMGVSFDFKAGSTIALTHATYSGVMTYRPYGSTSDWTGGPAHQLAFNINGMYWRKSTGDTTWDTWYPIVGTKWFLDGMKNTTQGGTQNNVLKLSHTTTRAYPEVWVLFGMNDSDNNNDNFCTCNSGSLNAVVGKRTYDSSGFNSWKSKFQSMSGLTLTTTNFPFSYNFTWWFYRKNVPAGTVIEIQKNQYGRDIFMAVIGGGDGSGALPAWVYMS